MRYRNRQLGIELCRDRVFVILLLALSAFTSSMFFFVHFSMDGNLKVLDGLAALTDSQVLYRNGLVSNGILAGNVLLAFAGLTGFAFALYFYRFFRANRVEMGCLKALGFTDWEMGRYFALFAVCMALAGTVIGVAGGYLASDILIRAGEETYQVSGLVKGITPASLLVGCLTTPVVAGAAGFWAYGSIRGKETGILIAGAKDDGSMKRALCFADRAAAYVPEKHRMPVRLALRKPVPVLLILTSSACFSIMFILAYSLNLSSGVIGKSQTVGHNYQYQTTFETPVTGGAAGDGEVRYLIAAGVIELPGDGIEQSVIGLDGNSDLFELMDFSGSPHAGADVSYSSGGSGERLEAPRGNGVVIGNALKDLYGLKQGDTINVSVMLAGIDGSTGKAAQRMTIVGIAANAATDSIYIEKQTLESLLLLPSGAYNGIWSVNPPVIRGWGEIAGDRVFSDQEGENAGDRVFLDQEGENAGDRVFPDQESKCVSAPSIQTHEEKLDKLRRDSVSNRTSAVINQVMGCFIGCILLYLALFLNVQDCAGDIRILRLLGYEPKEIRILLIDIYQPILWLSFVLTLWPGILTVKAILKSLSLQIGDYIPFQTNALVIAGIFLLQNLVYQLVQRSFQRSITRTAPLAQPVK